MSGTQGHRHVFLELCCSSDSELAAAVVEHSVAIQASSEDLQLVSTRRVLHRLLRICKAYDVVVNIWVSIETGDLAMTYKLVAAIWFVPTTLCELVANSVGSGAMAMSSGTSSCLVSTASFGTTICR